MSPLEIGSELEENRFNNTEKRRMGDFVTLDSYVPEETTLLVVVVMTMIVFLGVLSCAIKVQLSELKRGVRGSESR